MPAPQRQIRLRLSGAVMAALAAAALREGIEEEEIIRRAVRADLKRGAARRQRPQRKRGPA